MNRGRLWARTAVTVSASALVGVLLAAQEPPVPPAGQNRPAAPGGRGGTRGGDAMREFLGLGRAPDAAAAARGEKLYAAACAFCHGADARGAQGPSLIRSEVVLHDDKGELIGPVVLQGRPDKGMPAMPSVTPEQITEVSEFLRVQVEKAANRGLYRTLYANDILTGNAAAGEAFFNGAGGCRACHSPTGDLAHVGTRYPPMNLQNRWLWPSGGRGAAAPVRATITLPSGEHVAGTIRRLDDYDVSIIDAGGAYRSWPREGVKVEIPDPLKGHRQLLDTYSDADIHNVTAYLATLK